MKVMPASLRTSVQHHLVDIALLINSNALDSIIYMRIYVSNYDINYQREWEGGYLISCLQEPKCKTPSLGPFTSFFIGQMVITKALTLLPDRIIHIQYALT